MPPAPGQTSNFFIAFRVLAPERRRAIEAVYGFCRQADDAVDNAPDAVRARQGLAEAGRRLEQAFDDDAPADDRLAAAIRRFDLPRRPFEELLEGVAWDLEGRRYETTEDLREYCYRVASSVGLLCVRIFGCRGDRCDLYARELGVALQWTNILRDIGCDLGNGRVYLTRRALERHRLTERDLAGPDADARRRLTGLIREEAAYAWRCHAVAERAVPEDERPKLLSAEIMAGVYRDLLRRVEKAGAAVVDRRIQVPRWRKAWIVASLAGRRRSGRRRGAGSGIA